MQRRDEQDLPETEKTSVDTIAVKVKAVVEDFHFGKSESYRESVGHALGTVLFQWPSRLMRSFKAIGALATAISLSFMGIVFIMGLAVFRFMIEAAMLIAGMVGYLDWRPSAESVKKAYEGALSDHLQKYQDAGHTVTDVKILNSPDEDSSNQTRH